jgi:hypothetical protein
MPNRTVLAVLTIALCASVALGVLDVATEIVNPRTQELIGLVPVVVMLTNNGDVAAMVPRLDVNIQPSGYEGYKTNIAIAVGMNQTVMLNPWVYPGGSETCTAYITYPEDENHLNDTDVVVVSVGGISGRVEMEPSAGMSLILSPSPLAGNVLHVNYSLNQVGPASVTLFDVSGRPVAARRFSADRAGELPLDLRLLSGGVYLVRLDDGRSAVTQKLVVQR